MTRPQAAIAVLFGLASSLFSAGAFPLTIFYDFENDTTVAVDKLDADGAQNGVLHNNVSIQSTTTLFGMQSARFDVPSPLSTVNPPFSTFEIGNSTSLGEDFTLALHVDNQEAALDFTRLISSFRGTGPVGSDRILFDYDPTGTTIPGLRTIVNNAVVQTSAPPAGVTDSGYHHFALTVDSGDVKVYFDGSEVASGNVGAGYINTANLMVGEDPHDGGGTANEQLVGNVDDILVINRTLSAADISALSSQDAASVLMQGTEYAAYYDFEGDVGTTITDKFTLDGSNDGTAHQNAGLAGAPRFGSAAGNLEVAEAGRPFSQIEVGPVGNLGNEFTLSVTFNQTEPAFNAEGLTRLFSTFSGTGSPAGRIILDFNHDADISSIAVRFILPDGTVALSTQPFSINERHTITATYNNGDVRLYLDGVEVASANTTGGVDLGVFPLFIGEDIGHLVNENFIGILDDVLILTEPVGNLISGALNANQVAQLHLLGASQFLELDGTGGPGPSVSEPPTWLLMLMAMLALLRVMRRRVG
jgi:hypothetical protein